MNEKVMEIPTVLFWVLTCLTVLLPVRWSVVVFLFLVQIDLSALGSFFISSFGMENAIKVIVIPTLLLLRLRKEIHFDRLARKYLILWAVFAGYACLAILWSPYKLPAMKMAGYLYAYGVLFVVFTVAWQRGWFTPRKLMFVVWCSLAGAAIQSYVLGNAFGSDPFQWRFTTFSGAQSFAPFLLSLSVLLLFQRRLSFTVFMTVSGAILGLLLTGSRSAFLGLLCALLIYGLFSLNRQGKKIHIGAIVKRAVLLAAVAAGVLIVVVHFLPDNRLNEMFSAAVERNATVEDVGTFGWRLSLYLKVLDELSHRGLAQLSVGSGTSSGAGLVLDEGIFREEDVDPNRAIHDEFLRALYEWGLPGLFGLLFLLVGTLWLSLTLVREGSRYGWAFLAIFGALTLSLAFENFLADSGSPGGVGYLLVLTSMMAARGLFSEAPAGSATERHPASAISGTAPIQAES